ncbi:MAG: hypothetical protein ACOC04_06515 [Halothece sp.]
MTTVKSEAIAQFRVKLANYATAQKALDFIEDCEGDLEDAAMSLAIRVGQQPQLDNAAWLDTLARKCRAILCQSIVRDNLTKGEYDKVFVALAETNIVPPVLIPPILLYVLNQGIPTFCQPLEGLKSL